MNFLYKKSSKIRYCLLPPSTHVLRFVVCMLDTVVSPTKTDELIKMLFWDKLVGPVNHVLDN